MDGDTPMLGERDGFSEHSQVASRTLYERNGGPLEVTVAIPTYRRPALLAEAIASAARQTARSEMEILVVDNDPGSNGVEAIELMERLEGVAVRYVRNDLNLGMFGNWNRCLQLARGKWVTILNDDDLLSPTFLEECFRRIADDRSINLIGTGSALRDERPAKGPTLNIRHWLKMLDVSAWALPSVRKLQAVDYFLKNPHKGSLGVLMRAQSARDLGGFFPAFFPSADFVFFVRFQQRHGSHFLSKQLATYRIAVNESLRPTVVDGWVQQGLRIREELMPSIPLPHELLLSYSRLQAAEVMLMCKHYFGVDLPVDSLRRRYGLPTGPVFLRFRLLRVLMALAAKISRW